MALVLTSQAFKNGGTIPAKYTCDGENISPPLSISGAPEGTKSFALIMTDPDIPKAVHPEGGEWDHWVAFNIPADTNEIHDGATIGTRGKGSRESLYYKGPCPPSQYEPHEHRYYFRLYALDCELNLEEGATKDKVLTAMNSHIIASAELIGRYSRT